MDGNQHCDITPTLGGQASNEGTHLHCVSGTVSTTRVRGLQKAPTVLLVMVSKSEDTTAPIEDQHSQPVSNQLVYGCARKHIPSYFRFFFRVDVAVVFPNPLCPVAARFGFPTMDYAVVARVIISIRLKGSIRYLLHAKSNGYSLE
jgi:hypothetical protein